MFICPICKNKDTKYIGYRNGIPYCRRCISLSRARYPTNKSYKVNKLIKADINYSLTKTQQVASDKIYEYVRNGKSCIVNAVCGAGKTELVYKSIEFFLNSNKKVAFTIPRKDVCIEIYSRLKDDYKGINITLVCGGNTKYLDGQLIVLTTHQLFRYKKYFDLVILDEADAFPYYKNDLLSVFLHDSCKGPIIYMSATIKKCYSDICKNIVLVNRRFHNVDLPVPIYVRYNHLNKYEILYKTIGLIHKKQILIFVPTIEIGKKLEEKTKYVFVYSSLETKQKYIDMFKRKKIDVMITTSILERGITFFDVQVIVFEAHHELFDKSSLIQIAGRVGRKIKAPTGKVFFLGSRKTKAIDECIKEITKKNKEKI